MKLSEMLLYGCTMLMLSASAFAQPADLEFIKFIQCGENAPGCQQEVVDGVSPVTQVPGGIVYVTLFPINDPGNNTAFNVTVTDVLPPELQYVDSQIRKRVYPSSPVPAPEVQCITPPPNQTGTIQCSYPIHAPNTIYDLLFRVRIAPGTPPGTAISNTATLTSPSDPNPANNTSVASNLTVRAGATLAAVPTLGISGLIVLAAALALAALLRHGAA